MTSDVTIMADGGVALWACQDPGEICNPHDNCAINAICGDDGYCHPQRYQNCDDGLGCTADSCGGKGLCLHEPEAGLCVLLMPGDSAASCVTEGTLHPDNPCRVCNPGVDSARWSPHSGGVCDDDDLCTKDDTCREGICRGTFFGHQCTDNLLCTQDVCHADGSCENPLVAGTCLIEGVCYDEGTRDEHGCTRCDPSLDANAWTPLSSRCAIGTRCYAPGEVDASGCGVCDPARDDRAWSRTPQTCFVHGSCYTSGEEDFSGCGVCDPSRSTELLSPTEHTCRIGGACFESGVSSPSSCGICQPTSPGAAQRWSVVPEATQQSWTFDAGVEGFTLASVSQEVGWRHLADMGHDALGSLYYGNALGTSYESAESTSGEARSPTLTLPSGQHAALHFWLYLDVESSTTFDRLEVLLDGEPLWSKSTLPLAFYRSWVPMEVDLSTHAGKSITLSFSFVTGDAFSNQGRGVFIDDVAVITHCGAL